MGMASPGETKQVEDAIAQFPEVRQELEAIEMSIESYAQAHAMNPSSSVKEKIFSQIDKGANPANHSIAQSLSTPVKQISEQVVYRIPPFLKFAVAAMLILLAGSAVLNYSYYTKYKTTGDQLAAAQAKMKQNEQANVAMKNQLNVMSDKNALPIVLNGTPHAPGALAKIYWMKNTGDVYVDPTNLPATPEGKQYQLWAIIDGKPVDGGMITTEKGIYHIQKMKSFGHADAFAITLEKAGGSPVPKGDMYVISKI